MERRDFLKYLIVTGALPSSLSQLGCLSNGQQANGLASVVSSTEDKVILAPGLNYELLIKWNDAINEKEFFGYNNDYTAFLPINNNEAIFWVNHEYVLPLLMWGKERSKENIIKEMKSVGGSILKLKRKNESAWKIDFKSSLNKRVDAFTPLDISWPEPIAGSKTAIGTLGNCSGGVTPWGHILTCEEVYPAFYGDISLNGEISGSKYKWETYKDRPKEHYGWVTEINPQTGKGKKIIGMGRFFHECATVATQKDKLVVYLADDSSDQHLYKYISNSNINLNSGTLYVADTVNGRWLSLDINNNPKLKAKFKNQTELLIHTRDAAKVVGATPLNRPEDIEIDPLTGEVYIALTNNKSRGDYYGSVLKISESEGKIDALNFKAESFIAGGKEYGFACPDNMVFDKKGNLWITTDISGSAIESGPYKGFGNNGLFVFLRSGPMKGKVLKLAQAPIQAEFTGPSFSADYKTLFLSVQHPGEKSKSRNRLSSHWPDGKGIPKSGVIQIFGETLDKIVGN